MQEIILNEQVGAATKVITREGDNVIASIHVDPAKLQWFIDMCQEQRNNPGIKLSGEQMMEEAFRIPEELYYQWMFEARTKGCKAGKETSDYIMKKLNQGEFDKLRVGKYRKCKI